MTEPSQRIDSLPYPGFGYVADRKTLSRLISGCYFILLTIALVAALPAPRPILSGTVSVETNLPLSPAIVRAPLTLNSLSPEWQARKPDRPAADVGSGPQFLAPAIADIDVERVGEIRRAEPNIGSATSPDRHFDARAPPSMHA